MAGAIVANFSNDLLRTLESPEMVKVWDVLGKTKSMKKLKEELVEVGDKVRGIKDALPEMEKKQTSSLTVCGWVEKLGDLLLDVDDLLDEIKYRKKSDYTLIRKVCRLFSFAKRDALSSSVRRLIEIRQNLDDISKQRNEIGFGVDGNVVKHTCFQMLEEAVACRVAEKEDIITLLIAPSFHPSSSSLSSSSYPDTNTGNISAIALVGLPGSGKTTLAQIVCNDVDVQQHFDLRVWACVSDLRTSQDIMTRILESATVERNNYVSSQRLTQEQLSEEIVGKRYLLVLDDMSTSDKSEWDSLILLLDKGAPGSKILLTTRYQYVGEMAVTTYIYKLGPLSDEDGWLLFKRFAFPRNQEQEQIGKNIVRKCENNPLILRLASNLVRQKSNWQQLGDEKLDMMDMFTLYKSRDLLNVLKPSYEQLNPYLKHCVAYCSLFPRDYEFSKQALIQLWMAQGFLEPENNNGGSNLEDIGDSQFQTLLRMSFFQTVKIDALGDIMTCRMRKMFHYMAQNEAGAGCTMASGNTKFDGRTLHISVKFSGSFPDSLLTARKLRTLLCHRDSECGVKLTRPICQMLISKFKRLRTLNINDCGLDALPDSVGDLIHLRFLDLSKNYSLVVLPESITKLRNLQVLNLNLCQQLKTLPQSMGRLAMLRCLNIEECDSLTYMPLGLEKLSYLQSLSRFVVCVPSEANKGSGGIRVLENLTNLRGSLKIELSGQWTEEVQNAPSANLKGKNLRDLKIEWKLGAVDDTCTCHYYEAFLEGLWPSSGLKVLCIEGYRGRDFPTWARSGTLFRNLHSLVSVSIEGCQECKHIPPFGQLKSLKYLTLRNMEGVQYMVDDVYDPVFDFTQELMFTSLEELTLQSFYCLKGWWKEGKVTEERGLPSFRKLSKLKIWNCPKLTSMPLFREVVEVDFLDVNQKLLEVSTVKVERLISPSNASDIHETLADLSYDQSSGALSYGLLEKLKLKTLHIKACQKMQTFPTVWDEGIQNLVIDKCDELTSVVNGLRHLNSLETLEISHCKKLNFWDDVKSFPWGSLIKLRILIFSGISKMKALPEGLIMNNAIKTVKEFHITKCSDLTALPEWIDQMSSLKHLKVEACPNLTKLPEGSNCLWGLDKLEIVECPQLMERCREGGEDRSKINPQAQVILHKSWRYGLTNNARENTRSNASVTYLSMVQH